MEVLIIDIDLVIKYEKIIKTKSSNYPPLLMQDLSLMIFFLQQIFLFCYGDKQDIVNIKYQWWPSWSFLCYIRDQCRSCILGRFCIIKSRSESIIYNDNIWIKSLRIMDLIFVFE